MHPTYLDAGNAFLLLQSRFLLFLKRCFCAAKPLIRTDFSDCLAIYRLEATPCFIETLYPKSRMLLITFCCRMADLAFQCYPYISMHHD